MKMLGSYRTHDKKLSIVHVIGCSVDFRLNHINYHNDTRSHYSISNIQMPWRTSRMARTKQLIDYLFKCN